MCLGVEGKGIGREGYGGWEKKVGGFWKGGEGRRARKGGGGKEEERR